MNASESFLSRDESTAIKGFLILLIVLAHNSIVMGATGLYPYLYSFHVYCFFILPFIYGSSCRSGQNPVSYLLTRQWSNWKRIGLIYLFWCCAGIVANVAWRHVPFQPWQSFLSILWGHQFLLARYCGFSFLWFLPTMLAVMFWRDLYFLLPRAGKIVQFSCSVVLLGMAVAGIGNRHSTGAWCPLALIQGFYFCMAGIAVRFLLERLRNGSGEISRRFALLAPLIPLYVYGRRFLPYGCSYLTWGCCPIVAFLCLYALKDWICRVKFFHVTGKYSLQIYLLHTVLFNLLASVIKSKNLFVGILIYGLTLLLCGIGICCVEKTKIFRWTIFPLK